MDKMEDFINKAQSLQEKPFNELSVKRCIEHSPSQQLAKRSHQTDHSASSNSAKALFGRTRDSEPMLTTTRTRTLADILPLDPQLGNQQPAVLLPKPISEAEGSFTSDTQALLTERQQQMITRALRSRDATVLAEVLKEHCPSVLSVMKKLLCKDVKQSCEKLCTRLNGSVLYGKDFESLRDFDFNNIWEELKTNQPFLVDLMNAVADNDDGFEDIKLELRVKYAFLYSILMNERWHELTYVKRMVTLLIIEGGCSKQVQLNPY